ncbi:MAG: sulfotransferase [Cyanobacteria bacterium J06621_8]
MVKPNFFIVGAPKCGTTALSEYLRSHPNIFMSDPKEPHYFAEDFPKHRLARTLEEYLELFQDASQNHQAVGEASVWYLRSDIALKNIYQFNPQAKIIVMLRNPAQMVPSYHSQARYNCDESEQDFERAWNLQWERAQGRNIPRLCKEPKTLQYGKIARFGEQIEKLLNIFPRQQIQIIWYEDFAADTPKVYENVLNFLTIPSDGRVNFERVNSNKNHRFNILGKLSEKPPKSIVSFAMKAKQMIGLEKLGIIEQIRAINKQEKKRQLLSSKLYSEIIAEYQEDIDKLSKILDKDLSSWKSAPKY